jgi:hypothetical protein
VEPEDVVHVLRRFRDVLGPGGLILDLQVIRPNPVVEVDGADVCEIGGGPLFATADPAAAAIDAMVDAGLLVEEVRDDHDVRKHYASSPTSRTQGETCRPNGSHACSRWRRRARCGSAAERGGSVGRAKG